MNRDTSFKAPKMFISGADNHQPGETMLSKFFLESKQRKANACSEALRGLSPVLGTMDQLLRFLPYGYDNS